MAGLRQAPEFLSPVISRVDIAWICVATGDPSPLHLDERFATSLGHRSVVVPGTMVLGWLGQYLEEWAGGQKNLRHWKLRFTSPVWPDEQLKFSGKAAKEESTEAGHYCEVEVEVTALDGRTVAKASARFAVPAEDGATK